MARYRVVQPYGRNVGTQSTLISEHATIEDALAAIDADAARFVDQGLPGDYVELRVIDEHGREVTRASV